MEYIELNRWIVPVPSFTGTERGIACAGGRSHPKIGCWSSQESGEAVHTVNVDMRVLAAEDFLVSRSISEFDVFLSQIQFSLVRNHFVELSFLHSFDFKHAGSKKETTWFCRKFECWEGGSGEQHIHARDAAQRRGEKHFTA